MYKILLWLAIYILGKYGKEIGKFKLRQGHYEDKSISHSYATSDHETYCEIPRD